MEPVTSGVDATAPSAFGRGVTRACCASGGLGPLRLSAAGDGPRSTRRSHVGVFW
jgi:hypothetical protein